MKKYLFAMVYVACIAGCSSAPTSAPVEKAEGCNTPLGFIPEGRTATGYLHQVESNGQHCQQGVLTCDGGVWAGAYIYPSCVITP
jgi:hypothetical protein